MDLRHYTGAPLTFYRDLIYPQGLTHKPCGLWVSVPGEDDWVSWNENEEWKPTTHAHQIVLRPCADLRVVSGVDEFDIFHRQYGAASYWRHNDDDRFWDIDWRRVASEHDGVVIAPYLWARRMDPHWYYTWDCASGCIWNLSAISEVLPVT